MTGSGGLPEWGKREMTALAQDRDRWRAAAQAAEAYIAGLHEGDCHRGVEPRKLCAGCEDLHDDWQHFRAAAVEHDA